jgi:hypothetical protein
MSKIDRSWNQLFKTHNILNTIAQQGFAEITAEAINTVAESEARLMAKFDTLESRPAIFRQHKLSIWPKTNGTYVVLQSEAPYIRFDAQTIAQLPKRYLNARDLGFQLNTLDLNSINTESQALAALKYSRVLHAIHAAHNDRIAFTDGGRNRIQKEPVSFRFDTPAGIAHITSSGVQIEPDAVHESDHLITMIEAKFLRGAKNLRAITSLHARQIALPHAYYTTISQGKKTVESGALYVWKESHQHPWHFVWIPIEICLHPITTFTPAWKRAAIYVLVEHPLCSLERYTRTVERNDLTQVEKGRPHTRAPFPQFNSFNILEHIAYNMGRIGVANIIEELPVRVLKQWRRGMGFELSKHQRAQVQSSNLKDLVHPFTWKTHWGNRNLSYLVSALQWLGLVDSYDPTTNNIKPSALCMMLAIVDPDVRVQRLWNLVTSSPIMHAVAHGTPIDQTMRQAEGLEAETTFRRRLSTARNWVADLRSRMETTPHVAYCT